MRKYSENIEAAADDINLMYRLNFLLAVAQ